MPTNIPWKPPPLKLRDRVRLLIVTRGRSIEVDDVRRALAGGGDTSAAIGEILDDAIQKLVE